MIGTKLMVRIIDHSLDKEKKDWCLINKIFRWMFDQFKNHPNSSVCQRKEAVFG